MIAFFVLDGWHNKSIPLPLGEMIGSFVHCRHDEGH